MSIVYNALPCVCCSKYVVALAYAHATSIGDTTVKSATTEMECYSVSHARTHTHKHTPLTRCMKWKMGRQTDGQRKERASERTNEMKEETFGRFNSSQTMYWNTVRSRKSHSGKAICNVCVWNWVLCWVLCRCAAMVDRFANQFCVCVIKRRSLVRSLVCSFLHIQSHSFDFTLSPSLTIIALTRAVIPYLFCWFFLCNAIARSRLFLVTYCSQTRADAYSKSMVVCGSVICSSIAYQFDLLCILVLIFVTYTRYLHTRKPQQICITQVEYVIVSSPLLQCHRHLLLFISGAWHFFHATFTIFYS